MKRNVDRWLYFAREDLSAAQSLFRGGIYNQVCFHCQQCVEKALKGMIVNDDRAPPRTHSIQELLRKASFQPQDVPLEALESLDDYYIPTRYPDAVPGTGPDGLPDKSDSETLLRIAEAFLRVVETRLGIE